MRGYVASDKNGFAIRSYIAENSKQALRAAKFEMGDSLGNVENYPLSVVKYPMRGDKHLIPVDLTLNSGWDELTPWE